MEFTFNEIVGTLFKLKSVLPQEALLKLYYALIHPHLIYGIIVWSSTFPTYLNGLALIKPAGRGKFGIAPHLIT